MLLYIIYIYIYIINIYYCKCSGSQNPKLISPVSIADALLIGSVPLSQGRDMKRQLDQWWNAVFALVTLSFGPTK